MTSSTTRESGRHDSYILTQPDGQVISYVGEDAARYYQARIVLAALRAIKAGFRMTRTATPTNLYKTAKQFTGKDYKRGQIDLAIADMEHWVSYMMLALPILTEGEK